MTCTSWTLCGSILAHEQSVGQTEPNEHCICCPEPHMHSEPHEYCVSWLGPHEHCVSQS